MQAKDCVLAFRNCPDLDGLSDDFREKVCIFKAFKIFIEKYKNFP